MIWVPNSREGLEKFMKKMKWLLLVMLSVITITGCKDGKAESQNDKDADTEIVAESENEITETVVVESTEELLPIKMIDDKYRNFYEIFVYSFYDSNQDGIGDFDGLTEKLDYLNDGDNQSLDDLGINGIWLMPIMTSTTYHKYDVVDYYNIDPQYGTMEDFKEFMAACDERDIHVILDMVINHTSSKHPWFVEATTYLKNLGDGEVDLEECPYVDYYNFSKEKTSQTNCQVPGTDWYYEGRFWSEMPDLNLANESVRKELTDIAKFWLDLGVSGFRLDAAKEFYSGNDTANIEVLTWYQGMIKGFKNDAYLVAEVWTDVNTYGKYYESGVDSFFNFAFANSDGIIANTVKGNTKTVNALVYGRSVEALDEKFKAYNSNYVDAPFYSNHDMARSAGYYSGEDRVSQTKIAGAMNLFMSGASFLYYGEELGMKGSGKDENKRAPMQWFTDDKAEGMCKGPDYMDPIKMINGSLEEQILDPNSIYQYYKKALLIKNQNPEIARGITTFLEEVSNEQVCVLKKVYDGKELLIVFNISTEESTVDLSDVSLNNSLVKGGDATIKGDLSVGTDTSALEDGILTLPEYGTVVIW